jgi:anti-sigma factor RsiW
MKNRPKREDWVQYLYGEIKPDLRRQLNEHLQGCAECGEELQNWKRSLQRLDAWKLPRTSARLDAVMPFLKWAAAALLVLGLVFGFGRLTARQADLEKVRARVEPEIRREFADLLRREIDKSSATTLAQAQRQAEEVGAAYYTLLKKDLDTVAINTDVSLRRAEQGLMQVADYKQPAERRQREQ